MGLTKRVLSVTVLVRDQDAALRFYVDELGFGVRTDAEIWPGARLVEVVPPGSDVGVVLLTPGTELPVAVRLATNDADEAFQRVRDLGVQIHNDEVIHLDGAPPMFYFADPDGNGLVYMQEDGGADE